MQHFATSASTPRADLLALEISWSEFSHPPTGERPRVSVVIPTLNEARNLPHVAARMPAVVDEVVIVDGNSVDGTAEVARRLWPNGIHIGQTPQGQRQRSGLRVRCGNR